MACDIFLCRNTCRGNFCHLHCQAFVGRTSTRWRRHRFFLLALCLAMSCVKVIIGGGLTSELQVQGRCGDFIEYVVELKRRLNVFLLSEDGEEKAV